MDHQQNVPSEDLLVVAAEAAAEAGDAQAVLRVFSQARQSLQSAGTFRRWVLVLAEAGLLEEAALLLKQGVACCETADAAKELACALGFPGGVAGEGSVPGREVPVPGQAADEEDSFLEFEPGSREESDSGVVATKEVELFLYWFGGRRDVYARQWYDERKGRGGYWPVREQLTPWLVAQHLQCRLTLGQYLLHPDNTASFAVLDLDPAPAALEATFVEGEGEAAPLAPALVQLCRRLLDAAAGLGLRAYPEVTGGFGLHLWLFFAPRLAGVRARALLRELLFRAGPQPPEVAVELFPKQERLSGKGLGNLVKLPLGLHQATLRKSYFLDDQMEPIADNLRALESLSASSPQAIEAALARRIIPLGEAPRKSRDNMKGGTIPSAPSPLALAEALHSIPTESVPGASEQVIGGCVVLRRIVSKAYEEHRLAPDEARALVYTLGLLGKENLFLGEVFAQAGVGTAELERVRHGRQAPMGCKRLRAMFGESCSCLLLRGCDAYATPVLHALREPPKKRPPRFAPWGEIEEVALEEKALSVERVFERLDRIEGVLAELAKRDRVPGATTGIRDDAKGEPDERRR